MFYLVTYLFWLNAATFALMGYDRHNAHYGLWRLPRWLPIVLACIGGVYGYLMALWLFGRDRHRKAGKPSIPWGSTTQPYQPPGNADNSPVPGWGGRPISGPDLPDPGSNKPLPPDPGTVTDQPPAEGPFRVVGNEVIAVLDSDNPVADMELFVSRFRQLFPQENLYRVSYYNTTTRMLRLLVPASERLRVMDRLESELKGQLNFFLTDNLALSGSHIPATPGFNIAGVRKYYEAIQAPAAWDITQGSPDVTVAIVDTFFALDHPDLKDRWRDPINIVSQTRNVLPPAGDADSTVNHGSHVAGIAIGGHSGQGAGGMAPSCRWIPIALGTPMYTLNVLEGVLYAIYKGADVVNLSLGAEYTKAILDMTVDEQHDLAGMAGKRLEAVWNYVTSLAERRKCVIVWAGGNENAFIGLDAMKRSSGAIKVSAVDGDGRKAQFSNHGNYQRFHSQLSTVSAPGVDVLSCVGNREYARWNGTSMAAPFVAGAVALMKSLDRSLSPKEIADILVETGRPTRPEEHIGPVIQVRDALLRVRRSLVHFDDLLRNPQSLLGNWEATKHLILTNNDDEYLDDVLVFFHFSSATEGRLTFRSVGAGDVYEAPLALSLGKEQLSIVQQEEARCRREGVTPIRIYSYECRADDHGLLLCTVRENGEEKFSFHLRKYHQ